MKRALALACQFAALVCLPSLAAAQDLAITNVRIVVGTGSVIENGTIVVRGGKITSVGPGRVSPANPQGVTVINGAGMTAVPGYIDGHKHVNSFNADQMRSLLESGTTTVLSGGGMAEQNLALAEHINKGEWIGPRVIPSGQINLRQTPAEARAAVQALAKAGVKHTGEIGLTPEPAPPQAEVETLKAIVDEAKKAGIQVNVHAVSSPAMVAAIDAGVTRLVHLPNKDWTSYEQADAVAKSGAIVAGLIAFGAPNIDTLSQGPAPVQWPRDDTARFRDGKPWPEAIVGANRDAKGRATGTEGGYTIINARRIWDADPNNHATISYSTDQNADDLVVLEHELKSFSIVFSMADIHRIIGPNAARFVGMADQIGTLEPGKLADIILLDGDPTKNIYEMLKTKVVFKEGKIVVDKRPTRQRSAADAAPGQRRIAPAAAARPQGAGRSE
jgi:imidazolonepropionase-like amidohydrolase